MRKALEDYARLSLVPGEKSAFYQTILSYMFHFGDCSCKGTLGQVKLPIILNVRMGVRI